MTGLRRFGRFWVDFVVGDDWRIAVAVVTVLAVTWVATHHGHNVWWLCPIVVVAALTGSVAAVAVRRRR